MDEHSLACLDFEEIRQLLAGYAFTGLGRGLAQNVLPSARASLVRRWLEQIQELDRLIGERGMPPFGGISDVREIVQRCAPPLRVSVAEMAQVGSTLAGTHAIAEYLRDLPAEYPQLQHLAARVGDFGIIAARIAQVIDERATVRDTASPKLYEIRRQIEAASSQIQHTIQRLVHDPGVRRLLQYPNYSFHGDRLVLPVRAEYRGRLPGIVHRGSDSGATLYVEPAEVVELNNQISNLRSEEQEEIGRLLWDLAHEVHLNGREIHKTLDTLAVLDLIAAKVRFAKDFELRCPALGSDGTLNVRGARHPLLLELVRRKRQLGQNPPEVVPIDYRIGQDFNLLIITGPNTGGKTVALKTIGLLSLMVQAGLPIPAESGSELGVFSNVLIDVGDEQSLQQSLSTFSGHLRRIVDMLRHAGPRSLLLIDELGAGTDPDEGAALGRAILDELLRLRCRAVVTTHLGALKGFALTRQGAENACVEFDNQTLMPTYRLSIGQPGRSNAIEVARRLGLPKRLLAAARQNLSRRARVLQAALDGTRAVKQLAEAARREAELARLEADKIQSQAQAARAQFEQKQAEFQRWLERVIHLRPGDPVRVRDFDRDGKVVRIRLDQQRAEVDVGAFSVEVPLGDVLPPETPAPPKPPRPVVHPASTQPRAARSGRPKGGEPPTAGTGAAAKGAQERLAAAESQPKPQPALPPLTEEQLAGLQPEDAVYVKRFHREGRIVRLKRAKRLAVVSVGDLEVEVPFDGLAAPARAREAVPTGGRSKSKSRPAGESPAPPSESTAGAPAPGSSALPTAITAPDAPSQSQPPSTPGQAESSSAPPANGQP